MARNSKRLDTADPAKVKLPKDKLLPRFTSFFFDRPQYTFLLWLTAIVFGIVSYTTLMRREGFPSVNIPLAVVNGTYFVNDAGKVDAEVSKPISDIALTQAGISSVQSQSAGNFFVIQVQYKDGVDAAVASQELKNTVIATANLPETVNAEYTVPYFGATGGDSVPIDLAISFYSSDQQVPIQDLAQKAKTVASELNNKKLEGVTNVFVKEPFDDVIDPATGQSVSLQRSFDRYGTKVNGETKYFNSVTLGVTAVKGFDVITLEEQVHEALNDVMASPREQGFEAEISAGFAPQIEENISELQRVLLEGLLAVLIVGGLVITIRASVITVIPMITVVFITIGFLHAIGYTLNVITLFALILALALVVDDTIIMVEAIDAARHRHKDRRLVIKEATRKVNRAMVAATMTAALSFVPLLFVGGVLGSFIQAIPVTIIAALLISLLVALIFIPFFARFTLLGDKQLGKKAETDIAEGIEARIANFIAAPMLWAKNSRKKLFAVGSTALVIGTGFIVGGLLIAQNVVFNIFPPTKDTNGLVLVMNYPEGVSIDQAQAIAARADDLAAGVIGENFVRSSYYASGSAESATEQIHITSYNKREVTSVQLVDQLQSKFDNDFKEARVIVGQLDVGPPSTPFTVEIKAENRDAAYAAAESLKAYLTQTALKRTNGTEARMVNAAVSSKDQYLRTDNLPIVTVSASFEDSDTTTLVTLAQDAVRKEFNKEKLAGLGLAETDLSFNIGQESENQDSFRTLALAFPILLVVMYILLALQFRSLLQPLLIFMAIPFSIFGIMVGLDITNNAISFFAMLGFFALVGLSIKNTILLTDFANQARSQGLSAVDSAVAALRERFRPLFATSVTAVVSLIPLAISSPFWEGLAVVLIFGLVSSTLLVVTVFPYYYLGAEFLRVKISKKKFFLTLAIIAVLIYLLTQIL